MGRSCHHGRSCGSLHPAGERCLGRLEKEPLEESHRGLRVGDLGGDERRGGQNPSSRRPLEAGVGKAGVGKAASGRPEGASRTPEP